jgi:hypothetical protein
MMLTHKQIVQTYYLLLSLGIQALEQLQTTGTRVARVHAYRVAQDVVGLLDQDDIEPQARAALRYHLMDDLAWEFSVQDEAL